MAADRFLVDLHAEPGALRQVHVAISGTDGLGEERRLVLPGRELDGRAPAPRRRHVERRGEARAEVERMRRDGAIGGLGERGDLLELGDAAYLGDAWLQDVRGSPLHDLAEAEEGGLVLA